MKKIPNEYTLETIFGYTKEEAKQIFKNKELTSKVYSFFDNKLELVRKNNPNFKNKDRNLEVYLRKASGEKNKTILKDNRIGTTSTIQIFNSTNIQIFTKYQEVEFNNSQVKGRYSYEGGYKARIKEQIYNESIIN